MSPTGDGQPHLSLRYPWTMPSTMIEVCNPATCELLGTVPDCDAAEVDRAVATARAGEPPADTDLLTDVYMSY